MPGGVAQLARPAPRRPRAADGRPPWPAAARRWSRSRRARGSSGARRRPRRGRRRRAAPRLDGRRHGGRTTSRELLGCHRTSVLTRRRCLATPGPPGVAAVAGRSGGRPSTRTPDVARRVRGARPSDRRSGSGQGPARPRTAAAKGSTARQGGASRPAGRVAAGRRTPARRPNVVDPAAAVGADRRGASPSSSSPPRSSPTPSIQVNKANADKVTSGRQIAGVKTYDYAAGQEHVTTAVDYNASPRRSAGRTTRTGPTAPAPSTTSTSGTRTPCTAWSTAPSGSPTTRDR